MSLWKKISLGVLIFIVLLLGTVAFLVGTTTGLHLLFNAANRWVPGLEIGQVTGGWRDLRLKNIRYEQPGVAVNAGEFHLAVKLGCLRDSKLCVNDPRLTRLRSIGWRSITSILKSTTPPFPSWISPPACAGRRKT